MRENELARDVFFAVLKVHKALGPGLLESAYQACLCYELMKLDLKVEIEKSIKLIYDGLDMGVGYKADIVVEDVLILELKVVDFLNDIHLAQLLSYLKLADCKLGLLINFNTTFFKNGVKRVVNGLK